MDAVTDPLVREIWMIKSAQVGWTEILNNVIGYHIDQDPSPIMLVHPTKDSAEDWSRDRFSPMVRDTPVLRPLISEAKSRTSTNTLRHKTFPGGLLALAISNSPASLASKPIRLMLFDEIDKYPLSAKKAGDPLRLATARTNNFWNRKILGGSTPTIKGVSKIEAKFLSSDQRYYFVPCPHCKEFQRLVWSQVSFDVRPARYVCQICGALWSDTERIDSLRFGEWRSTKPSNGIAGFHISEIYSPFVRLDEMVEKFLEAKKLPETLQQFVNESLGETFEQASATVESDSLLERREPCSAESIPLGVHLLTLGGDTQDDRVEVQLLGWGADEECWILEQRVFRGDPGKRQLWLEVDAYLLQTFHREDGKRLLIEAACIDSGGHNTQAVYDFVVSRKRRRVWAIKGMAGAGRLAWPKKANRTPKSRANVFIVGVDTIKSVLYGRLGKVSEPGPGYIHLPQDADADFCKQLTSEKSLTKYVRGRPSVVWEPREKGAAQEAQDCWVYGYAAMLGRGGPKFLQRLLQRKEPGRATQNPEPSEPIEPSQQAEQEAKVEEPQKPPSQSQRPQALRQRPTRRKNWVRSW